jgi:hypothetical protein
MLALSQASERQGAQGPSYFTLAPIDRGKLNGRCREINEQQRCPGGPGNATDCFSDQTDVEAIDAFFEHLAY